jgi:hypothetical protein
LTGLPVAMSALGQKQTICLREHDAALAPEVDLRTSDAGVLAAPHVAQSTGRFISRRLARRSALLRAYSLTPLRAADPPTQPRAQPQLSRRHEPRT